MREGLDDQGTYFQIHEVENTTPIVFIHGVGLNHEIWNPQINYFNNTTIAYDILGHGDTSLNKEKISFNDFSEQLLNLIDELKFEKIHLVGFSIGSLIARNFAPKHNNRLCSLTLLCSTFKKSEKQKQIVNDRFELSKKSRILSKQALRRWFTDEYLDKNPNTYKKICTMLDQNNIENFLKVYELFVKHEDDENLKKIEAKTLIITGENDIGSTPEMSENLSKEIANSKVKIISKGKHLCGIECADDVNMEIKNFIDNV